MPNGKIGAGIIRIEKMSGKDFQLKNIGEKSRSV